MFEFVTIGKVLKPFKNKGYFLAEIDPVFFADLEKCEAVFLQINGIEVPFFIESIDLDKETSFVKLEEFDSPEAIKAYNGKQLFLRTVDVSNIDSQHSSKSFFEGLSGFSILDKNSGNKLEIDHTEEYPQQWMAICSFRNKEILIPLVEEWIVDIDPKQLAISMDLPDGFFD